MSIDVNYTDRFADRHIGPSDEDTRQMLDVLGLSSLDELTDRLGPELGMTAAK